MCEVCGKTFKRNNGLNLHRTTQEEQGPGKFTRPFNHCQWNFYKQTIYIKKTRILIPDFSRNLATKKCKALLKNNKLLVTSSFFSSTLLSIVVNVQMRQSVLLTGTGLSSIWQGISIGLTPPDIDLNMFYQSNISLLKYLISTNPASPFIDDGPELLSRT